MEECVTSYHCIALGAVCAWKIAPRKSGQKIHWRDVTICTDKLVSEIIGSFVGKNGEFLEGLSYSGITGQNMPVFGYA